MLENTPFDDALYMLEVTGDQLRHMVQSIRQKSSFSEKYQCPLECA